MFCASGSNNSASELDHFFFHKKTYWTFSLLGLLLDMVLLLLLRRLRVVIVGQASQLHGLHGTQKTLLGLGLLMTLLHHLLVLMLRLVWSGLVTDAV